MNIFNEWNLLKNVKEVKKNQRKLSSVPLPAVCLFVCFFALFFLRYLHNKNNNTVIVVILPHSVQQSINKTGRAQKSSNSSNVIMSMLS